MGNGSYRTTNSCTCLIQCVCDGGLIIQFGVVREIPSSLVSLKLLRQSAIILCRINVAESDWNDIALWGDLLRGLNKQLGTNALQEASDIALYLPEQLSEGELENGPYFNSSLPFLRFSQWRTMFQALKPWNPCRWVGCNSYCYKSAAMNLDPKSRHTWLAGVGAGVRLLPVVLDKNQEVQVACNVWWGWWLESHWHHHQSDLQTLYEPFRAAYSPFHWQQLTVWATSFWT